MKNTFSKLLVLLMIISILSVLTSCSGGDVAGSFLDKTLEMAKSGAEEYAKEVDSATADDVDRLREDGNKLLSSLDDVTKALDEDEGQISDDAKNSMRETVEELRQTVSEAMTKLETK